MFSFGLQGDADLALDGVRWGNDGTEDAGRAAWCGRKRLVRLAAAGQQHGDSSRGDRAESFQPGEVGREGRLVADHEDRELYEQFGVRGPARQGNRFAFVARGRVFVFGVACVVVGMEKRARAQRGREQQPKARSVDEFHDGVPVRRERSISARRASIASSRTERSVLVALR